MTYRLVEQDSLLEAIQVFKQERAVSLAQSTIASDYFQLELWVGRCPFRAIEDGRKVLTWVLQQEPQKSARKVATLLKAFYSWASSQGVALLPNNPVASYRLPKALQEKQDVVVVLNHELPLVIAALERRNKQLPQWDLYAQFMLQTGMRTGEVRALRDCDVDLGGKRVHVHANYLTAHGYKSSTKTNRPRWVPLNSVALDVLGRVTPVDGFLFPWNRYSFQNFFAEHMGRLLEVGAIRHRYRPYDLRHTAISRWLEAGVPVAQAAAWAGNTPAVIWRSYAGASNNYEIPVI